MDNTLCIQLTVTDEQIQSLLQGKLESLPDEKVQEIFSNVLAEFFKTSNGQKLFYTSTYYDSTPKPTEFLNKMISNAISKDLLAPCVDEFISTLKGHYPELIKTAIVEVLGKLFFDNVTKVELKYALERMESKLQEATNR